MKVQRGTIRLPANSQVSLAPVRDAPLRTEYHNVERPYSGDSLLLQEDLDLPVRFSEAEA